MRRRDFIWSLSCGVAASALPYAGCAQPTERVRRIAVLMQFAESDPVMKQNLPAFEARLHDSGWEVGKNVEIDYRFAAGESDQIRAFTKEVVAQQPDVIVTNGILPILATREKGGSIPVVFLGGADLVGRGLLKSLAHPGGNVTGFTNFEYSIIGKWMEFLKRIAPGITRVGLIFSKDAAAIGGSHWISPFDAAAASFGVEPVLLAVHDVAELENVSAAFGRDANCGILTAPDIFTIGHHTQIAAFARQNRIPGCYPYRNFVTDGGLMSYGPNGLEMFRQAASYVDRILKGAYPGDLPVQQPSALELIINLKTAEAFGLSVPLSLLALADELIE